MTIAADALLLREAKRQAATFVDAICSDPFWAYRHALIEALAPVFAEQDADKSCIAADQAQISYLSARVEAAESLTLLLAQALGEALNERNTAMVNRCASVRDAAALKTELEALKRSEDEARVIANDGELNADPQLLIEHLTQQCRDFIRERDDERRYSKRLEAEQDQASARHILLAARVEQLEGALKPFCFGDPTLEGILYSGMPDRATGTFTITLGDIRRARTALAGGADAKA